MVLLLGIGLGIYGATRGSSPLQAPRVATSHPITARTANPNPSSLPRLRVDLPVPTWTALAVLHGSVSGYSKPAAVGPVRLVAPAWGTRALPVVARRGQWLDVRVIGRANGQTTWIPAADVSLRRTPYYIVVDLSRRRLLLFWERKLRLFAPAGIGTPSAPTPPGHYFVACFAQSPNPGYGPFVIVTSGLASTLTDWEEEGTPVITLNGPLDSASRIASNGAAVSEGSVRLLDDDLRQLRPVPAGTPVDIVPTVTPPATRTAHDSHEAGVPTR